MGKEMEKGKERERKCGSWHSWLHQLRSAGTDPCGWSKAAVRHLAGCCELGSLHELCHHFCAISPVPERDVFKPSWIDISP